MICAQSQSWDCSQFCLCPAVKTERKLLSHSTWQTQQTLFPDKGLYKFLLHTVKLQACRHRLLPYMSSPYSQGDGHITAPAVFVSIMQHNPLLHRMNAKEGKRRASCDWHHSHCLPPRTGTQTNLLFPGLPALPVLQLSIQIPGNCKIEAWPISGCPGCFQPSAAFFKCDVVLWLPLETWKLCPISLCYVIHMTNKRRLESGSRICNKWLRCDAEE